MSTTAIEWATHVWNPVSGCTKVSAGCKNCYAERMSKRLAGRFGYPADEPFRVTLHHDKLEEPLRWRKPRRVFVNSMSDLFHEAVPDEFIDRVFATMACCSEEWHRYRNGEPPEDPEGGDRRPAQTFMVLTKRPERMRAYLSDPDRATKWWDAEAHRGWSWGDYFDERFVNPLPNVWLGVSAEDQVTADARIPHLVETPAAVRFVSCEPLLGPVDLTPWVTPLYHGGYPDLDPGDFVLPTNETGASSTHEFVPAGEKNPIRTDRVYVTADPRAAEVFAGMYPGLHGGGIHRVVPELPVERDPDCTVEGLSWQCPKARVVRNEPQLHWVIVGGESGPKARPMHPDWVRSIRDQCVEASVPFFFKQWGEWAPVHQAVEEHGRWFNRQCDTRARCKLIPYYFWPEATSDEAKGMCGPEITARFASFKAGKKAAGRALDGEIWSEIPA